jgi:hypothetical protein
MFGAYPLCFVFAERVTKVPSGFDLKHVVFVNSTLPPITLSFIFSNILRVKFLTYASETRLDRITVVKVDNVTQFSPEDCFFWAVRRPFLLSSISAPCGGNLPYSRFISDGDQVCPFETRYQKAFFFPFNFYYLKKKAAFVPP